MHDEFIITVFNKVFLISQAGISDTIQVFQDPLPPKRKEQLKSFPPWGLSAGAAAQAGKQERG